MNDVSMSSSRDPFCGVHCSGKSSPPRPPWTKIEPSGIVVPVAYQRGRCMPGRAEIWPVAALIWLMSGLPRLLVLAPVQLSPPNKSMSPVSARLSCRLQKMSVWVVLARVL